MGASASEEIDKWVSVSDLALATRRMRVVPALPSECQVEVLRRLWRSLRYVPAGEILVTPSQNCDRMFVVARGEAEVILGSSSYIPLLPEGTFVCEAALLGFGGGLRDVGRSGLEVQKRAKPPCDPVWMLRAHVPAAGKKIPRVLLGVVAEFLTNAANLGPRFQGKVRITRRSLIAELARTELLAILEAHGSDARALADMPATCNALQNVTVFGVEAQEVNANDIAARVVCDGPMNVSCTNVAGGLKQGLFGACLRPSVVE